MLINKNIRLKLNSVEKDKSGRFLLIDCVLNANRVTLVNVYGTNHDDPPFFNEQLLKIVAGQGHCLVGGDFTLVFNPTMGRSLPKSPTPTKAAVFLNHGIKELGLCDVWRTLNPNQKDFSFYSNFHKSYSRIDMFLAPQQIISRIKDCTYLAAALSDHNPMKMTLLIDSVQPSPQRWRFKTFMLKDPEFITYMNAQIDLFFETNVNSASNSIMWDALKVFMRGCILSYI